MHTPWGGYAGYIVLGDLGAPTRPETRRRDLRRGPGSPRLQGAPPTSPASSPSESVFGFAESPGAAHDSETAARAHCGRRILAAPRRIRPPHQLLLGLRAQLDSLADPSPSSVAPAVSPTSGAWSPHGQPFWPRSPSSLARRPAPGRFNVHATDRRSCFTVLPRLPPPAGRLLSWPSPAPRRWCSRLLIPRCSSCRPLLSALSATRFKRVTVRPAPNHVPPSPVVALVLNRPGAHRDALVRGLGYPPPAGAGPVRRS